MVVFFFFHHKQNALPRKPKPCEFSQLSQQQQQEEEDDDLVSTNPNPFLEMDGSSQEEDDLSLF
jgi:hypothetical protein